MSEENKGIAQRAFEEVYGNRDPDVADEIYAPDFVDHDPATPDEMRRGPDGVKQQAAMYGGAFPDIQMTVEDQVAEGDKVVTRWSAHGTHLGVPGSGNQVTVIGITIARLADGKIQEEWTNWDGLGLMEQIGAMPGE
ncbi:MAG: ester cyclase [Thermoleophilaceae bacterium]|nr:ester cyclase [Thermoleophilaceae bacterium]